jgi:diadenosine tetraphosphate (Ap4A) HIT family hydrolase/ADP-ribose pyrophosphatase YjhB (NUDIX family)
MPDLPAEEQKKQEYYRDARSKGYYGDIWTTVGKCVFCDLRDKYIILEENGITLVVALFAYIDGNMMIVPRRHVRSVKELTASEWETARKFMYLAKKMIRKVHDIKGLQYMIRDGGIEAQSTVSDHLHIHCIPFDAPDLSTWNYRELKYTPLENVALYKQARKKIIELDIKYDTKYTKPSGMRIVCDAIILNTNNQVLLQERKKALKLRPDYLTLPGGGVDRYDVPLEDELMREVAEETGVQFTPSDFTLVDSRLGETTITRRDEHIQAAYPVPNRFIWNTYIVRNVAPDIHTEAGDDCESLVWMDATEALSHERISPGIRAVLRKAHI